MFLLCLIGFLEEYPYNVNEESQEFHNICTNLDETNEQNQDFEHHNVLTENTELQNCEVEGLRYIAGYVAHRFRLEYPYLGSEIGTLIASVDFTFRLHS